MQLLAYDGANENLFRAAFMQSGSALPVGDITDGQHYFDTLVSQTNCTTAFDKLACLREVPYANLTAAINTSPSAYAYQVSQVIRIFKLISNRHAVTDYSLVTSSRREFSDPEPSAASR